MYKVSVVNGKAFIEGIKKADTETRAGAVDGIRIATADLAEDVARHTPVKSGKARDSVIGRVSPGGAVGKVTYSYKKRGAFYMAFILQGAKGHKIGLRLKTKRGLAAAQRYADRKAAKSGQSVAPKITRRRAMSFTAGGKRYFRGSVMHPGLKSKPILNDRLAANGSRIFSTISKSVARRLSRVADIRTTGG
jgi:hypothetical protein